MPDHQTAADEQLIRAFVNDGDRDALEVLLRRHENRVYGLAYRLLGNRPDALDASQEVFVALFRKARSFRGEAAFSTWLHRLTVNACYDLGRKRARAPEPVEQIEVASNSPDPIEEADDRMQIEAALAGLPQEQRSAVVLRDLRGLSYSQIAEATRAPVGTVKSRIARARMALAGILRDVSESGPSAAEPSETIPAPPEPGPVAGRLTDKE